MNIMTLPVHIEDNDDKCGWLWIYTALPHASAMNECSLERQHIRSVYCFTVAACQGCIN